MNDEELFKSVRRKLTMLNKRGLLTIIEKNAIYNQLNQADLRNRNYDAKTKSSIIRKQ